MKQIKLTQGKYTLVDDTDFDYLNQWKWHYSSTGYAVRKPTKESKNIFMHRLINKTPNGFDTDHINRNKLDNRKNNLRTVTSSQNSMNMGLGKNNKSGFVGVHWGKQVNQWVVQIRTNGKTLHIGCYPDIQKAIEARKLAEVEHFKEFSPWFKDYAD